MFIGSSIADTQHIFFIDFRDEFFFPLLCPAVYRDFMAVQMKIFVRMLFERSLQVSKSSQHPDYSFVLSQVPHLVTAAVKSEL
jgi:hypothetical protein